MVNIKFLGTGGGRFVTITQERATGGFYIDTGKAKLYIDPGPGALVHAVKEKIPLKKLDIIFVSHAHIDHINDAQVLIEVLTNGCTKRNGIFTGSLSAVEHLDEYHKNHLEKIVSLNPGEKFNFKNITLKTTKALHTDATTIGFVLKVKGKRIGYTSDSVFFNGFPEQFKECDVIIINCPISRNPFKHLGVEKAKHMDMFDVIKFLSIARPKLAVLNHYGMSILKANPEKVAKLIQQRTGVETKAIKDFEQIEI